MNGLTEERGCTSNEQCDKDENSDDSADTNASIAANTTSNAVKNETLVKQVGNLKQSRATAEADQAVGSTNKAHMQTIKEDGNNKMVFHIANVNVNKAMPNKPTVCPDSTACPQGTKCHMINNVAVCVDIDECKLVENGACGVGYVCINTVGSRVCQDIDECLVDDGGCGVGFLCRNTIGSRICVDIDECAIDNGGCLDGFRCINTIGSRRCVDIDECATTRTGVDDLADPNMKLPDAVASSPSFSSVIAYPDSGDYLAKCDPETETCVNLMGGYKCVPNEREKAELDSNRKIAPNPTFVGLGTVEEEGLEGKLNMLEVFWTIKCGHCINVEF